MIGKKEEAEKKEVNINFLVELLLVPSCPYLALSTCTVGTHSQYPLAILAHTFTLPRGRTEHVRKCERSNVTPCTLC